MVNYSFAALAVLASCALASPLDRLLHKRDCHSDNCLRGFRGNPGPAEEFCSSVLGRVPVTSTAYDTKSATVTSTQTDFTTTSVTEYISTLTTVITIPADVVKREVPATAVSKFSKSCGNDATKISSQCNCFIALSPTPTVWVTVPTTITETVPATVTEISTSTFLDTTTTTTTTTSSPAFTPIIVNGGFDDFPWITQSIAPWTININNDQSSYSVLPTDDFANGTPPNMFFADCIGGNDDPYAKVTISQNLNTVIGQTYTFSFRYKMLSGAENWSYIVIWIDGVSLYDFNDGSSDWTALSTTFTANSVNPALDVTLLAAGWESTQIWVDSIDVVEA